MKTLVTGGTGFIGRYVVEELLSTGRTVLVLDRHMRSKEASWELPDGLELMLGDIRDVTAVTEAMAHVDSWIHLAGVLGTQETIENPRPAADTNIMGGLTVLAAAAQYDRPGVNIAVGNYWMDNTYAITKSAMERFCTMYRTELGLPVTVVRVLNAYGPRQVPPAPYGPSAVRKIIPSFVMKALHKKPIEVYGDGQQVMDMVYVGDVARVLVEALAWTEQSGSVKTVLEVGTGRKTTVRQIADAVIDQVGEGRVEHLPMRPGEPERSVVLGNPATLEAIGWRGDLTPLESGLKTTVDWYRGSL